MSSKRQILGVVACEGTPGHPGKSWQGHTSGGRPIETGQARSRAEGDYCLQVFDMPSTEAGPAAPCFISSYGSVLWQTPQPILQMKEWRLRRWGKLLEVTQLEGGGHGLELRPASVQGCHWVSSECPAQAGELLSGGWATPRPTACQVGAVSWSRHPWQQDGRPCGHIGQAVGSEFGRRGFKP